MTILSSENAVANIMTATACMIGCQSTGDFRPPVNLIRSLEYFTQTLTNQNITHNSGTFSEINVNISIIKPVDTGNTKCNALVNNANGSCYQCTRNRKFGQFCGLHHNRKNSFKSVIKNEPAIETKKLSILLEKPGVYDETNND